MARKSTIAPKPIPNHGLDLQNAWKAAKWVLSEPEPDGMFEALGRDGARAYQFGAHEVALYLPLAKTKQVNAMVKLGARVHQRGDDEVTLVGSLATMTAVCKIHGVNTRRSRIAG